MIRSENSGCCSRKMSKAGEPAQDVLRQVRTVHAQDRELAPAGQQPLLEVRHGVAPGDALRRPPVDRERVGADPDLAVVDLHHAALHVDLELQQVAAALQEVAPVRARVEPDDVVGQQPAVDLVADAGGQHAPGVRLRPRDVHEVVQERVGPRLADHRRQRVELVVVDHHDRLVEAVDLLEHRVGEVPVDDVVAELERLDLVPADVRRVALVPQVVLDEPEHRVGEDVVEAVVGLGVGGDEAHAELAAVGRLDLERLAAVLLGDAHVLVGHRRRDPDRVAVRGQADQGRGQPAGAALGRAVLLVGDGSAVGDEDEWGAAVGHTVGSTSCMILR